MTVTEISDKYTAIKRLIADNNLAEVFPMLEMLIENVSDYLLREELDSIRNTYGMMLHYYLQGSDDSKRQEMYNDILKRIVELNNRVNYRLMAVYASSEYFSAVRKFKLSPATLDNLISDYSKAIENAESAIDTEIYPRDILLNAEELQRRIFLFVWTRQYLSRQESDIISTLLSETPDSDNTGLRTALRCAIIGALYLGCCFYYDKAKIKLLITCALNNTDTKVLARAYTLLAVLLTLYHKRTAADRTLRSILSLLADATYSNDAFRDIVIAWTRTSETKKINKTIQEEIIPGLMKLRPEIEKNFRDMEGNLPGEGDEESEYNPAWESFLEKSGLEEKLRKLNDLQMEGADMFMMAFARMKQAPFFQNEHAWFLPFSALRTEVHEGVEAVAGDLAEVMEESPLFCHTDRYSMFIGFSSIPKPTLNAMSQQISAQIDQFKEDKADALKNTPRAKLSDEISLFVKDLYRFYHQFSRKNEYRNPFDTELNFMCVPVLGELLKQADTPEMLGNLYFKRGLWNNAIQMSEVIEERYKDYIAAVENLQSPEAYIDYRYTPGDEDIENLLASMLERKGFAQMKLKQYSDAIITLTRAQRYQESSAWVLSNIARCYNRIGNHESAAHFLDAAIKIDPDNVRLLLRRGRLDMETGRHDEAVKIFYKLVYLHPENMLYRRMLAWCRCLQNEPQKALEQYEAIPACEREESDFLNMGHCLFSLERYIEARNCYAEFISHKSISEFIAEVKKDIALLPFLKGKEQQLAWLCDAAAMKID